MADSTSITSPVQVRLKSRRESVGVIAARIVPLDALRGFIIILMALDHANAFIAHTHAPAEIWSRPLPLYSDALAFVTRFVTHLAAPGFFFLMGVGMTLFAASRRAVGWSDGTIMRHFLVRGAVLVGLQFFLENRAWALGEPNGRFPVYFGVLYGLGGALVLGAFLLRLPSMLLVVMTALTTILTLLLLPAPVQLAPPFSRLAMLLFSPGGADNVSVLYPVMPWLAVVTLGMVFGRWMQRDRAQAYRGALVIGLLSLAVFFILRPIPGFWNIRAVDGTDWIAFFNLVKYPPSIVFLLLTLGCDLILLSLFSRFSGTLAHEWNPFLVFGSTPLFFYISHLYLYAIIGIILGRSTSIPEMYPYWLLGLMILYPLCWLYGKLKQSQPPDSLLRLF